MPDNVADQSSNEPAVQPGAEDAGSTANSGNDMISLKVGGREVSVPAARLNEYAQKGLDYERKMLDLKKDKQEYEAYRALKERIAKDPVVREKLERAFAAQNDEESVSSDDDDDDGAKKYREELRSTRGELDRQRQEFSQRMAQAEARMLQERIDRVVSADPLLRAAGNLAKKQIVSIMTTIPDIDIEMAATEVRNEIELLKRSFTAQSDPERFQTVKGGNAPNPPQSPKLSGSDLDKGDVRRAALAMLNRRLGNQ